jgi:twinkle protein
MDVRQYLTSKGFEWSEATRPSGINAIMNCPFCEDTEKKFAINIEHGAFKCEHENRCGVKGSWTDFQRKLGDEPRQLDGDGMIHNPVKKTYSVPKSTNFLFPTETALSYLTGRGFTKETITKYKLAMTQDGKEIAIPYYKNGKLTNVKYRNIEDKSFHQEKDCEPTLFNRDNIPQESTYLIITEGEFDAVAMCQYGFDAVSMPGGASNMAWIETEWEWLQRFKEIYLCFDMDVAGDAGVQSAIKRLGSWRCKRVVLPYKDANDCLKSGVLKEQILEAIKNAEDFKPAMLCRASDFTEQVNQLIQNPDILRGSPTAFEGLSDILGGWRSSELTIWTGKNASGKSTIINQEIINLISRGVSCCIASLEMPAPRYLRWAVVQYTHLQFPNTERVKEAMNQLGKRIYVVNTHEECDIDTLLDIFRYAARRYDCKHFVIDSLMRVKMNQAKELQEQKEICNKLVSFASEYGAHTHLVAHPRKGYDDDDRPGKVDVKGSSHITDLAHNVLIMWRPSEELKEKARKSKKAEDPVDARLYIKKNRELGTEGSIKLWFEAATKCFSENPGGE